MMHSEPYIATAERIGARLCRDAFWYDGACTWLGWSIVEEEENLVSTWRSFGPDLYRGTSGIALFLTQLHALRPRPELEETIVGALRQALATMDAIEPAVAVGLHTGRAGVAHALLVAGEQLGEARFVDAGIATLESLREIELPPGAFDVISGVAGAIPVLTAAARRYGRDTLADVAARFGDHLVAQAVPASPGLGWIANRSIESRPLCGYSHGAAGVSLALAELLSIAESASVEDTMRGALDYERAQFDALRGNWPDLRRPEEPAAPPTTCAWCHGAAGIGLARLRLRELLPDDAHIDDEISAAIRATCASLDAPTQPALGNHSLCHGALGNADFLVEASIQLDRPELLKTARRVGALGIESYEARGEAWRSGMPDGLPTPGLMLGDAGVGWVYLRLGEAKRTGTPCRLAEAAATSKPSRPR